MEFTPHICTSCAATAHHHIPGTSTGINPKEIQIFHVPVAAQDRDPEQLI